LRLPESATTCSLVHDAENGFSPRGSFITALLADAFANFPCGQYWEQCPVRLIGTQIEFVAGADSVAALRPDPEVVAKAKRRTYTAEYKQRILLEAEAAAATRGGIGALLRREGLYSSLLTYWRRERAQGVLEALTPQKRGPKSKRNPMEEENQKLRRQNARLTEDLRKAQIIIDVQKKVAALLGNPIPEQDPEEQS